MSRKAPHLPMATINPERRKSTVCACAPTVHVRTSRKVTLRTSVRRLSLSLLGALEIQGMTHGFTLTAGRVRVPLSLGKETGSTPTGAVTAFLPCPPAPAGALQLLIPVLPSLGTRSIPSPCLGKPVAGSLVLALRTLPVSSGTETLTAGHVTVESPCGHAQKAKAQ